MRYNFICAGPGLVLDKSVAIKLREQTSCWKIVLILYIIKNYAYFPRANDGVGFQFFLLMEESC